MRYTRKNISELLDTVQGNPDVMGFWTSNFAGSAFTLVPSPGGMIWQDVYAPSHQICEDGIPYGTEDGMNNHCGGAGY
ncbi:hypothetical protein HPP05_07150 [Corallococcus exiguus]|uniref:hypothetical protein n=1 Tax=Corallococcus exiguus TaxID=83462 RepID=UPI0014944DF1|nr:hypothetical protein [Corallococcus exiguus]NPC69521.1 hypothetical protein [Corallococcus exiguus]